MSCSTDKGTEEPLEPTSEAERNVYLQALAQNPPETVEEAAVPIHAAEIYMAKASMEDAAKRLSIMFKLAQQTCQALSVGVGSVYFILARFLPFVQRLRALSHISSLCTDVRCTRRIPRVPQLCIRFMRVVRSIV